MNASTKCLSSPRHLLCILVSGLLILPVTTLGADGGTTTGIASFQARGSARTHDSGMTVWSGSFVGVSVTDSRRGLLHNMGWECTGETIVFNAQALRSGGFCLVTDGDGDVVNVIWERTDIPGPPQEPRTRGTYVSGTGKYSGIQGHYTLACRQSGVTCLITGGEYHLR